MSHIEFSPAIWIHLSPSGHLTKDLTHSFPQATTHVYVTIVDENDNAPMFQQPHYEVLLDEGPDTLNTSLITIQALDLDEGPNGTVIYAIVAGNIINTFRIDRHMVSI